MIVFSTSNEGINVSRVYGLSSFKVSPVITCKISVTVPVRIKFYPLRCYFVSKRFQMVREWRKEGGREGVERRAVPEKSVLVGSS